MPTKDQVWGAADRVLATGERVSQRSVIASLRQWERGGSTREVGPHLFAWITARNYKPRLEVAELPERLQGELVRVVKAVWDEAMIEAAARLADETALVRAEREANHALRDEAWLEARTFEAENAALRARKAEMEDEVAQLRKEMRRMRAAEFWDRVMREVAEILAPAEALTAQEIVRRLPPTLAQEAIAIDKPLTPGRLNRKMAIRIEHRRYFEEDPKTKLYRRLAT
ncbi:hypothetical protein FV242_05870 [Methylobacterium sp. WL64]|uniref:DNA-binding protein n=1 Tax=Methylobacterium sp. WL64 TaxID=2603894 RepID=UPI0011C806C1|nr:DNA-binding protein [Methylobacterium sp. WL64]TXN04878.1 hypothetical protein FV242_05870 [Methylobacterium sp. WL64]